MLAIYPDMVFWCYFLCFNTIIFLPVYLIHIPQSDFFPKKIFTRKNDKPWFHSIFCNTNQDIFRVSADLAIITLIAMMLKHGPIIKIFSFTSSIYFVFIVLFQVTNAACRKIYHKELSNFEVMQYLSHGYTIVKHSAIHQVIGLIVAVFTLLFSFSYFFFSFFSWMNSHNLSTITIAMLFLFVCIPFYVKKNIETLTFSNKVFTIHLLELYNIFFKTSFKEYFKTRKIDFSRLYSNPIKTDYSITKRPNVFVIAIESYGRIVMDELGNPANLYKEVIAESANVLKNKGYKMVSAFASSPISGAGSWISYTSFLFGINLKNQMVYNYAFASEEMHKYNHLFRFLQKMGYTNYRANAVGRSFDGVSVPWDAYTSFYAVDKWIHFKEMEYTGQMYGLGPAPADQYILHKSLQIIKEKNKEPFSYFLLTQNSHNPFHTLPIFCPDWQDSNIPPVQLETKGAKLVSYPKLSNYFKAIEYEIKTVSNFIATEGNEDDIFIVFGDHQPPIFNEAKKGNETPVHVITKNELFLHEWKALGFKEGLMPSLDNPFLKFEGIYSIFQRAFVKSFSNETNLPGYEPDGKTY